MKNWSLYEPASEESIMSLADWLQLANLPLFRNRLDIDYLSRVSEYRVGFVDTIHAMGKTGPFWQVG